MTHTPLTAEEIEALDRLEKAATPSPWHHGHNPDTYDALEYFRDIYSQGQPGRIHLTCIPVPGKDVNDEALFTAITGNGPTSEANALLIAAARNALPKLLAAASRERALDERVRELEAGATATASSSCPVCRHPEPHGHDAHDIRVWINNRLRSLGFMALDVVPIEERCPFCHHAQHTDGPCTHEHRDSGLSWPCGCEDGAGSRWLSGRKAGERKGRAAGLREAAEFVFATAGPDEHGIDWMRRELHEMAKKAEVADGK